MSSVISPTALTSCRLPPESLELISLHADSIGRWLTCFSVVNFDLSIGQVVEYSLPTPSFSESELQNIANLAFPDSNSGVFTDMTYTFRLRSQNKAKYPFYFGYVFFRQMKDAAVARGYFQKSIVMMTHLPLKFEPFVSLVGKMFFECGATALETALNAVAHWPAPVPSSKLLELPCLGTLFELHINPLAIGAIDDNVSASNTDDMFSFVNSRYSQNNTPNASPKSTPIMVGSTTSSILFRQNKNLPLALNVPVSKISNTNKSSRIISPQNDSPVTISNVLSRLHAQAPGLHQHVNLYKVFGSILHHLWFLWEKSLLSSAVLFVSKTPDVCSQSVLAFTSLITPVIYRGDYRPYFTIYDVDFKHFSSLPHSSVVIGSTNPFFLKAFENFSNVIHVLPNKDSTSTKRTQIQIRRPKDSIEDIKENCVVTTEEPLMGVNDTVLNQLLSALSLNDSDIDEVDSFSNINNSILRRHFYELTLQFLNPFQKYFTPVNMFLAPNESFNPFLHPPALPVFREHTFIEDLGELPDKSFELLFDSGLSRSNLPELYSRFFRSPHFYPWFNKQLDEARLKLERRIETIIRFVDMKSLMNSMPVRQALLVLESVQNRLASVVNRNSGSSYDKELLATLKDFRIIILSSLPDSIRSSAMANHPLPTATPRNGKISTPTVLYANEDILNSPEIVLAKLKINNVSPTLVPVKSDSVNSVTSRQPKSKKELFPVAVVDNFF